MDNTMSTYHKIWSEGKVVKKKKKCLFRRNVKFNILGDGNKGVLNIVKSYTFLSMGTL